MCFAGIATSKWDVFQFRNSFYERIHLCQLRGITSAWWMLASRSVSAKDFTLSRTICQGHPARSAESRTPIGQQQRPKCWLCTGTTTSCSLYIRLCLSHFISLLPKETKEGGWNIEDKHSTAVVSRLLYPIIVTRVEIKAALFVLLK